MHSPHEDAAAVTSRASNEYESMSWGLETDKISQFRQERIPDARNLG